MPHIIATASRRHVQILLIQLTAFFTPVFSADSNPRFESVDDSCIEFVHSFGDDDLSNLVETNGAGVALFDYDNDGRLDVFFVNTHSHSVVNDMGRRPRNATIGHRLFRNLGGLSFQDVTMQSGIKIGDYGMGCAVGDLDNDGDRDLIITNFGANRFYRNNAGTNHWNQDPFLPPRTRVGVRPWAIWMVTATWILS